MKIYSLMNLLVSTIMILSIFTPTVMGTKDVEPNRIDTYRHYALKDDGFQDSNVHSALLGTIEKEDNREVDVIITAKKDKDKTNLNNALIKADGKKIKYHKLAHAYSTRVKSKDIKEIARHPDVDRIFPDFRIQTCLDESVNIIGADALQSRYNGSGITVAVIDTGIDSNHPDLKNRVIDQVSFVTEEPSPDDGYGHGTHVAGIIAGSGAASSGTYKGVAPEASLMNVKVLGKYGWGSASSVMSGIEYAVDNGADVISLSVGGSVWPPDGSDPVAMTANAAVEAGVVVVAAAGNSGASFLIISPASAEKVIAVGATTKQDDIAAYSSIGPTWDHRIKPEISAPGGSASLYPDPAGLGIVSAKASGSILDMGLPDWTVDKYYMALSGTSMATPHVSGVAALMLQAHPDWTPEQIKQQLMNTAVDIGYDPITQGAGRIDASAAVDNTLSIAPASFSYISEAGQNTDETIEISNSGTEKITVYLSCSGEVDGEFQKDTIRINPGQTQKIKAAIGVPAGLSTGLHYGSIVIDVIDGDHQSVRLPVLIDTPMTFVAGVSQFTDTIDLKSSEYSSTGTNYYYFDVPEGISGISTTMTLEEVPGWVDLYLLDPEGNFVDYDFGWESETERTVSATDPMPGKWMLLADSYIFDSMQENICLSMTTQLNSLTVEPASWIVPSIMSSGTDVEQVFTVTNAGESVRSVQVEGYMSVPNNTASGGFEGSVEYEEFVPEPPLPPEPAPPESTAISIEPGDGTHTFDIPADAIEYTLAMTALNNTAFLMAEIYDPDGRSVYWMPFGWFGPSTDSIKINDPMSGTWRVDVWAIFANGSTKEYYSGSYDVLSKDTSWMNTPQDLFIPAMSQEVFTSTLTPPDDASGDFTGGITVSGSGLNIEIPVAASVGESITHPGNFTGDVANNAWKYYIVDVNSDYLNTSIEWDNVHNDLDLFVFDPSGAAAASSTQSGTMQEAVTIPDPVSGTWTIGVYGHSITEIQQFLGTVC